MKSGCNSHKLRNQLCFPLYACSKELIRRNKSHLDALDLTYTQYITMAVLWEKSCQSVKDLGNELLLDSGTLTPVLKKLEAKGYIKRNRSTKDERSLVVNITDKGEKLQKKAEAMMEDMEQCVNLSPSETSQLCTLLNKVLVNFEEAVNQPV